MSLHGPRRDADLVCASRAADAWPKLQRKRTLQLGDVEVAAVERQSVDLKTLPEQLLLLLPQRPQLQPQKAQESTQDWEARQRLQSWMRAGEQLRMDVRSATTGA